MYVVSNTKENGNYFARLHAIDITTGAERSGSPVEIKATVAGTGNGSSGGQLAFSPLWENQRPALALYNGYVYIGFAAHGDNGPWHGWLFSYNASTLAQKAVLCLSPNSYGAGIWASGAGLPIDDGTPGGRMFVVTGNGPRTAPPFNSTSSFGESVVAFSLANGGITPTDEFTPYNYQTLNNSDWDLGSGGILMVPDQQGAHPHVADHWRAKRDASPCSIATTSAASPQVPPPIPTRYRTSRTDSASKGLLVHCGLLEWKCLHLGERQRAHDVQNEHGSDGRRA